MTAGPAADSGGNPGSGRAPLAARQLRATVCGPGRLWREVQVVERTGSTNADVAAAARTGAPEGLVVVAEYQSAGRGRAGRDWTSPPRAGLSASVLLRPALPAPRWGWLPLLAGVALVEAVTERTAVPAGLKWPNDLLVRGHKCAGILAEVVDDAVVLGIGLNVTNRVDELPPHTPPATSLALAGARALDRSRLLQSLLLRLEHWYARWRAVAGDVERCGLLSAYRAGCETLGQPVRAHLPDGGELFATATAVDDYGRLVLALPDGQTRALAAGDVTHLRPSSGPASSSASGPPEHCGYSGECAGGAGALR